MKTSNLVLLLVATLLVIAVSVSQASVNAVTMALVGPSGTSQSWFGYARNSVLRPISMGIEPGNFPGANPSSFTLAPDQLPWGAVAVFKNQSVWLGEEITDPTSTFYGQRGNMIYFPLIVKGDGVHKICAQVTNYLVTSTNGNSLAASGMLSGLSYDGVRLMGGLYGPSGQIVDGIHYGSGNLASGDTLVDWFIYLGVTVAWDATELGLSYIPTYINSVGGSVDVTVSYTVDDRTGDYTVSESRTIVPEPTTLVLLGIGAIRLIRRRK